MSSPPLPSCSRLGSRLPQRDTPQRIIGGLLGASAFLVALASTSSSFAAEVLIDRSQRHQTIEGFGFFGGADVWWSSPEAVLDTEWTHMVVDDLGLSMWRSEYYPEETASAPQDANWDKQRPVVQALADYAAERKVPLKVILTAWTPPADLKCVPAESDGSSGTCATPVSRPADTKGGNVLDPSLRSQLAAWFVSGLDRYSDIGVDVYAISFQNEPLFSQPYNSCVYYQKAYVDTLAAIGPAIKAAHPGVKLFGSENMLGIECGAGANGDEFDSYWYTANILSNPAALSAIDAFAVHGYVDGVSATATSKLANLWSAFRNGTAASNKSIWMTETSGYFHEWPGTVEAPGGLDLAQAIYAGLYYGHLSAWTYWQGSDKNGATEYSLMKGTEPAKNYYVAKQFYRYIRPGAQMVQVDSDDPNVMVVAFEHADMGAFTVVAINAGDSEQPLELSGESLPTEYQAIRTSASEDAADLGTVTAGSIQLPPKSITTLVSGNVYEHLGPGGAGTGGAGAGTGGNGSGAAAGQSGGTTGLPDGSGAGSSETTDDAESDSGCGCSAAGADAASGLAWLPALAALGYSRVRRRR